jgi:hypothetical protein
LDGEQRAPGAGGRELRRRVDYRIRHGEVLSADTVDVMVGVFERASLASESDRRMETIPPQGRSRIE